MALWRNLVETHHTQNVEGAILVLVRIRLELHVFLHLRGAMVETHHIKDVETERFVWVRLPPKVQIWLCGEIGSTHQTRPRESSLRN